MKTTRLVLDFKHEKVKTFTYPYSPYTLLENLFLILYFQARLVCLSTNVGQTQINGQLMNPGSSEMLYHQAIFTVGDRSFRWEYPNDSALVHRRSSDVLNSPRNTPTPKVLTPNNGKTKGTAVPRYCSPNMDEDIKKAIPILG